MKTWAEYLRESGADDESVKLLDTPAARKAYERQQADAAAAIEAVRAESQETMTNYRGEMTTWQETVNNSAAQARANEIAARAEVARAQAIVAEAARSNAALKEVAIKAGWKFDGDGTAAPTPTPTPTPAAAAGLTREDIHALLMQEREAILLAQEIPAEHARLFPGQPFSFRALVDEAARAKKPANEFWEQKYKVSDARAKLASDAEAAKIAAAVKSAVEAKETELASRYGNPNTRPPAPSDSPFTKIVRPAENKQPWERQSAESDRVTGAISRVGEKLKNAGFSN